MTFTNQHPGITNWGANSIYTVGTAGDNQNMGTPAGTTVLDSEFRVNRNYKNTAGAGDPNEDTHPETGSPRYERISPRFGLQMDLITGNQNQFRIFEAPGIGSGQQGDGPPVGGVDKGGDLLHLQLTDLDDISETDDHGQGNTFPIEIELRRRANPLRGPVTPRTTANQTQHESESQDNPWIVVDQMTVTMDVFSLKDLDNFMNIRNQLATMKTNERRDPLIRQNSNLPTNLTPLAFVQTITGSQMGEWQNNSLGLPNILGNPNHIPPGATYTAYNQYQPHFNRPYGSAMELMAVPIYGPGDTTKFLAQSDLGLPNQFVVAADKFKNPVAPNMAQPETGNRWYRLFEFLEVPDRSHQHPQMTGAGTPMRPGYVTNLGNRLGTPGQTLSPETFYRRPGRIQLNTLRNPEVLGGLLDDFEVARLNLVNPTVHLPDQTLSSNRDWWVQFVQARDGIDPISGAILPGLPSSKPFRPMSYSAEGVNSLQSTILRTLPLDSGASKPRTLFELGNQNQQVDHSVKYRMLEKVSNNSTTRSNVFLIFVQVDFFQAVNVTDSGTGQMVVRVGAKLSDSPGYRSFFVVDRSKSKYLLNQQQQDFPQSFTDQVDGQTKFNYSFNQDFDYHQLILHRQTIN